MMERNDSAGAITSLATVYADESPSGSEEEGEIDNISASDDESHMSAASYSHNIQKRQLTSDEDSLPKAPKLERKGRSATRLVSYGPDEEQEEELDLSKRSQPDQQGDTSDPDMPEIIPEASNSDAPIRLLPESVRDIDPNEIKIPSEPHKKCSKRLQEKIRTFHDRMLKHGADLNNSIQRRKDFRNPSIYEKLITFCKIDEKGTNFPPAIYNPKIWGKDSFYDELAKSQKVEMDKREKERKERTKVEFVTGTKKAGDSSGGEQKRKSKWDSQAPSKPVVVTTSATNPPVVSVTTSASGTKTTVISAIGMLKKPK